MSLFNEYLKKVERKSQFNEAANEIKNFKGSFPYKEKWESEGMSEEKTKEEILRMIKGKYKDINTSDKGVKSKILKSLKKTDKGYDYNFDINLSTDTVGNN